jgi:transcriptional regulator with XRE-family HTH domain
MAVGEQVRDYRIARGLTQGELAARTGIPPTAVSRIETNDRKMTFEEAVRVAGVLRVSLSMLAGLETAPTFRETPAQELVTRCLQQGKTVQRKLDTLVEDLRALRVYG